MHVDFTPVAEAAWIGLPIKWNETVFSIFSAPDVALMVTAVITIMPIRLMEKIQGY